MSVNSRTLIVLLCMFAGVVAQNPLPEFSILISLFIAVVVGPSLCCCAFCLVARYSFKFNKDVVDDVAKLRYLLLVQHFGFCLLPLVGLVAAFWLPRRWKTGLKRLGYNGTDTSMSIVLCLMIGFSVISVIGTVVLLVVSVWHVFAAMAMLMLAAMLSVTSFGVSTRNFEISPKDQTVGALLDMKTADDDELSVEAQPAESQQTQGEQTTEGPKKKRKRKKRKAMDG